MKRYRQAAHAVESLSMLKSEFFLICSDGAPEHYFSLLIFPVWPPCAAQFISICQRSQMVKFKCSFPVHHCSTKQYFSLILFPQHSRQRCECTEIDQSFRVLRT